MSPEVLSPLLLEAQGIRYAIANETFGGAIIELLSECFSREPMSAALGLSARDLAPLVARFVPESTTNGLSVIAMPADHSEILAGAFICRDFKSPPPAGVPGDFLWFSPIAEAVMTIDDAYDAKRPGLVLGEAEDLWMVGVRPSARFARQGIASTLFRLRANGCQEGRLYGMRAPGLSGLPLPRTSGIRRDRTTAHRRDFVRTGV